MPMNREEFILDDLSPEEEAAFSEFCQSQKQRKEKPKQKLYQVIMAMQLLCQIIIVQYGGRVFSCISLNLKQWAL